jgi:hypothetical protein
VVVLARTGGRGTAEPASASELPQAPRHRRVHNYLAAKVVRMVALGSTPADGEAACLRRDGGGRQRWWSKRWGSARVWSSGPLWVVIGLLFGYSLPEDIYRISELERIHNLSIKFLFGLI